MTMRLLSIELEGFRGFASAQRFDLDGDIVLVRGDNGTGKTSLTDGLLWLFTGDVPRLRERAKGLRKSSDPLVCLYRPDQPARVQLEVRLPSGRVLTFAREGGSDGTELTAWEGGQRVGDADELMAESLGVEGPVQAAEAVGSWGILQQHSILAALDSGQALHQRLAEVVGLEHVTRFATAAAEASKSLKGELKRLEKSAGSLAEQRNLLGARLVAVNSAAKQKPAELRIAALVRATLEELPPGIAIRDDPTELDETARLGLEVSDASEAANAVVGAVGRLRQAETSVGEAAEQIESELAVLKARLDAAVRHAPAQIQLASAALELLGDGCPVCRRPIDEKAVRTYLLELQRTAQEEADAAASGHRAVAEAQERVAVARRAEAARAGARAEVEASVGKLHKRFAEATWLKVDSAWLTPARSADLAACLSSWQTRLREAYAEGRRSSTGEVVRLTADLSALDGEIERAEPELAKLRDRVRRAKALEDASRVAAQQIVERALKRLEPSFSEVFDRLAPHPTFTELRATQDIFYGKNQVVPQVWDSTRGVGGNPALVLSEGQLNVVALSYFLGLALNAGDGALPFLVLDDPLQAMDVVSVLGFADLCRRIREHRQLIVTTHDRRFAALLGRKLAPREAGARTILHEFEGWTELGPQVSSTDQPLAEVVPLLRRDAS